jgi:hypothetical protein
MMCPSSYPGGKAVLETGAEGRFYLVDLHNSLGAV